MSLRAKLFLNIGFLLLFLSILSFILPNYLLKKDIDKTSEKIKELVDNNNTAAVSSTLHNMRTVIIQKMSSTLAGTNLVGLALAFLILGYISKKVSRPIAQLAKATEAIEKGHYEEVELPAMGGEKDEVAILAHGFEKMVEGLKEREKIRGVLNKVVSKQIASEILNTSVELGGEERTITLLFSDIRSFTKMTEHIQPRILISLMNAYLTEMCKIIDENTGVVDKFVGDEIMALFGAPLPSSNHAFQAISSALKMIESLQLTNEKRALKQLPPVEVGIGIHTGLVVAGNVGSEQRLNYTVLGANVNLASRLCSAAKGMQILISEATLKEPGIQDRFLYEKLAPLSLKGIETPVAIYEIKGLLKST